MYNSYELSKKKHCVTRRDQLHSGTRCGEGSRQRRWGSGAGDRRGHDPDPAHTQRSRSNGNTDIHRQTIGLVVST